MAVREPDSRTGSEFEVAFMSDMSHHHAMAMALTGLVLMAGHHEDLFTLAEDIATSQGQEIRQTDQSPSHWYGLTRPLDSPIMTGPMMPPSGR